ncbi:hypothetical protein ES703_12428 [subsurface metagenome]
MPGRLGRRGRFWSGTLGKLIRKEKPLALGGEWVVRNNDHNLRDVIQDSIKEVLLNLPRLKVTLEDQKFLRQRENLCHSLFKKCLMIYQPLLFQILIVTRKEFDSLLEAEFSVRIEDHLASEWGNLCPPLGMVPPEFGVEG